MSTTISYVLLFAAVCVNGVFGGKFPHGNFRIELFVPLDIAPPDLLKQYFTKKLNIPIEPQRMNAISNWPIMSRKLTLLFEEKNLSLCWYTFDFKMKKMWYFLCLTIVNAEGRPRCVAGDVKCLKTVMNQYIKQSAFGIREINLAQLDPLFVPEINIVQGSNSPVSVKLNFKNLNFIGLSTALVTRVVGFEKNPRRSKFEFYGRIPRLTIMGHYKVNGKVIILPVVGDGPAKMVFENVDVSVKGDPRVEIKNGKEYLQFTKLNVDFTTTRLSMNFENLFNGNELLGRTANQFFNENWVHILSELKHELRSTIGNILKKAINPVFATYPYADCFLGS